MQYCVYVCVCVCERERERERDLTEVKYGLAGIGLLESIGGGYERVEALLLR